MRKTLLEGEPAVRWENTFLVSAERKMDRLVAGDCSRGPQALKSPPP